MIDRLNTSFKSKLESEKDLAQSQTQLINLAKDLYELKVENSKVLDEFELGVSLIKSLEESNKQLTRNAEEVKKEAESKACKTTLLENEHNQVPYR